MAVVVINALAAALRLFCICDMWFLLNMSNHPPRKNNLNREIYLALPCASDNVKWKTTRSIRKLNIQICVWIFSVDDQPLSLDLLMREFFRLFFIAFPLKFRKQELLVFFLCTRGQQASKQITFDGRTKDMKKKTCNSLWHNTFSLKEFTVNGYWN